MLINAKGNDIVPITGTGAPVTMYKGASPMFIPTVAGSTSVDTINVDIEDFTVVHNGVTITIQNRTLTLSGTSTKNSEYWMPLKTPIPAGMYKGTQHNSNFYMHIVKARGDYTNRIVIAARYAENFQTFSETTYECLYAMIYYGENVVFDNVQLSLKIQTNGVAELTLDDTYNDKPTEIFIDGNSELRGTGTASMTNPWTYHDCQNVTIKASNGTIVDSITLPQPLLSSDGFTDYIVVNNDKVTLYQQIYEQVGIDGMWVVTKGANNVNVLTLKDRNIMRPSSGSQSIKGYSCTHGIPNFSGIRFANQTADNFIAVYYSAFGASSYDEFVSVCNSEANKGTPIIWRAIWQEPVVTDITDTETGRALLALKTYYPDSTYTITANGLLPSGMYMRARIRNNSI